MRDKLYSDWLRIDLHIHTNKSNETKTGDYSGEFSVDVLHSKLVDNSVSLFSLTDHNIVNVDAYEEYYLKYNSENDPKLLVGVELDIEKKRDGGETRNYHTLLIFNYSDIEGAKSISQALEQKYSEKGLSKTDRKITFDELSDIFFGEDFFFIPHAGNDQSIVAAHGRDEIEDAQKMVILMQSAIEKVSKEETQHIYNEGFDRKKTEGFRAKKDIAYINFSDNHNINRYPCKHKGISGDHNFYYIKGSNNYETIRLAFIDPESRIMSSQKYNALPTNEAKIEKFRISDCEFIEETEFEFSPDLNVIIGGRSSGKSLLLWLLCKSIDSLETDISSYNIPHIKTIIKGGNDNSFKDFTSINKEDIIRISQGEIVSYFEKKELKVLAFKVGKKDEYQSVLEDFEEHNDILNKIQNRLSTAYNNAYDETLNKTHVLHARTIENILSQEVVFNLDAQKILYGIDKSSDIEEMLGIIEAIQENITKFSNHSLITLDKKEENIKDEFLELLKTKNDEIIVLQKTNNSKVNFIEKIEQIISEANSKLDLKAKAKTAGIDQLKTLKTTIKSKIQKYGQLKNYCDEIENFDYALCKEIDLYENIKLVLEVSEEASLKTEILDTVLNPYTELTQSIDSKRSLIAKSDNDTSEESALKLILETIDSIIKKYNNTITSLVEDVEEVDDSEVETEFDSEEIDDDTDEDLPF